MFSQKAQSQMPMFVATAFLHNFQKAFEVQQAVKKFNSEFLIQQIFIETLGVLRVKSGQ